MSKPDATWKIPKTQFEEWATSDSVYVNFGENDCTEFQKFHRVELMIAPKLTSTKPSVFTSPTFILN
jgi:hypothetical protein